MDAITAKSHSENLTRIIRKARRILNVPAVGAEISKSSMASPISSDFSAASLSAEAEVKTTKAVSLVYHSRNKQEVTFNKTNTRQQVHAAKKE